MAEKPRNLAQLKKFFKPGDTVNAQWRWQARRPEKPQGPQTLTVSEVQTVAIIFAPHPVFGNGKDRLWSRFEKAARYTFTDAGYTIQDEAGEVYATYTYVD